MFLFWNGARILTYLPTILKLLHAGASARDYSLATWGCWVMSNGTFCLYLYEQGGRVLNGMVLINAGNTLMCLVTSILIFKLQRAGRQARAGISPHAGSCGVRPVIHRRMCSDGPSCRHTTPDC